MTHHDNHDDASTCHSQPCATAQQPSVFKIFVFHKKKG